MAYKISDKCNACGMCFEICPTEAVIKGKPYYSIDAEKCIDCAACATDCPEAAISPAASQPSPTGTKARKAKRPRKKRLIAARSSRSAG